MADKITVETNDLVVRDGDLVLRDGANRLRLRLDAQSGDLRAFSIAGDPVAHLDAGGANLYLGSGNADGDLVLFPADATGALAARDLTRASVHFDGAAARASLGADRRAGELLLRDAQGEEAARLAARPGALVVEAREVRFERPGGDPSITLRPDVANLTLGRKGGGDGDLLLLDGQGRRTVHVDAGGGPVEAETTVHVGGAEARVTLGGRDHPGSVVLRDQAGRTSVRFDGGEAAAFLGGRGVAGSVTVRDQEGRTAIRLDGEGAGRIEVRNAAGEVTVAVDGETGDVVLTGADCAEDFEIEEEGEASPAAGSVLVIMPSGRLAPCRSGYDRRVAGIVAGAGDLRPGLILGRGRGHGARVAVALVGRVFCRVDARRAPIAVGDLLTTSPTPGHAMKATNRARAFGAVLGKALQPLAGDVGLIPVLVAMQ